MNNLWYPHKMDDGVWSCLSKGGSGEGNGGGFGCGEGSGHAEANREGEACGYGSSLRGWETGVGDAWWFIIGSGSGSGSGNGIGKGHGDTPSVAVGGALYGKLRVIELDIEDAHE